MLKATVLRIIGERNAGRLDYFLNRKSADAWGALNGQRVRQAVYAEIISRIPFEAIVETGTFRGTTTDYFSKSGLPVFSVEIHPRWFAYASLRFRNHNQVRVFEGNSPDFLTDLTRSSWCPRARVLFYLDAHVQDSTRFYQAPLVEELEIILSNWQQSVVMIDDFQVPGSSYGFDDWGEGRNLSISCFESLKHHQLELFFPAADATEETGARRGWVVLCWDDATAQALREVPGLRYYGGSAEPAQPQKETLGGLN
jgi:hypothetical protein